MNNSTVRNPQPVGDDFDALKPSERFARLASKVFSVKKRDFDEHLKSTPPERLKPGPKPKPATHQPTV